MKRLPGIVMAIGATLIVLVALTVSGLRLALPHLNSFCPQIVSVLNRAFDADIQLRQLHGSWQSFGPTLDIGGIDATTADERLHVQRATLALDVWQSLLHWRWQFRDVTFYRLQLDLNTTLMGRDHQGSPISSDRLSNLFLRQFDHFILRGSQITFLTPSGERTRLSVPQLTWLNTANRHRAEGKISLSNTDVQQGAIDVRMDLHDQQGLLDNGKVYLKAQDVDLKPWFSQLLQSHTGLQSADFSLAAWLTLENGEIAGADALLSRGAALWQDGDQTHRLDVNQLALHLSKRQDAWQMDVPALTIATDGQSWAPAALSLFWLPAKRQLFFPDREGEIRLRASGLALERFTPLLPLISAVTPTLRARWHDLQPRGELSALALDIPLSDAGATRFQARWRDLGWQPWELLPGADHVSGEAEGSLAAGRLQLALDDSTLPYQSMFRAPLALSRARATFDWRHNPQDGLVLWGRNIDAQARSLWANGDFYFHKPVKGEPWLDILAGLRLDNAADAWRYFPEPLMGTRLVDYLTGALIGGQVENATLLFAGNPSRFPFKHNDGQFEVWVPLKQAEYQFEPGWPALTQLDIDLDFVNDGLFMHAPQTALGEARGHNIAASIPDYSKEKLLIDAGISGAGSAIRDYFLQTPLKASLGKTLDELEVGGPVNGDLHLDIPLDGQPVTASGTVALKDNSLYIKPLGTTLQGLSGTFHYNNGNLDSAPLDGQWFGQPIAVNFTTREKPTGFDINVCLKGDWALNQLPGLPAALMASVNGRAAWQSDIAVALPLKGETRYEVAVKSDLKNVSSHLLPPLDKSGGQPFSLAVNAKGDMHAFLLSGHAGSRNSFNSQWLLGRQLALARGAWAEGGKIPPLPTDKSLTLSLPALDGEKWLALLKSPASGGETLSAARFRFPDALTLRTPALTLGGQVWHQLALTRNNVAGGSRVTAQGKEINGALTMTANAPWRADLDYFYYNPAFADARADAASSPTAARLNDSASFADWPALAVACRQCWIKGQNLGRVSGNIKPQQDQLLLTGGVIDTGNARLTAEGSWLSSRRENRTSLKGTLEGKDIGAVADYLGMDTPLREAPFHLNYDLHWRAAPWQPAIASLNGVLHSQLGKGKIENISSGSAGRILRLVSFDALLRKLQFDFSDAFGKGFYFDSIKGTAWLKDGTLHTNDLLIDGLEADIAMTGDVDFNRQHIDMEAVIAPEISATVGVTTAFVINPVVGAAVFAASKVLAPLWNKLSLIRYHISGSLDAPEIQEVLRQPRGQEAKSK
ncbi:AsmA2 domain-containing protein YhdP [Sodalis sp. (in: enterobacteria)]|uniref:AsmA2 domain-containing protein YhdP n=1 Tax=Sodalis sp. (in: enterobacteria) TaxID=1898979 RepID=UPI003F3ECDF5